MTSDEQLEAAGQGHLVRALAALDEPGRARLAAQIDTIDLDVVGDLVRDLVNDSPAGAFDDLAPPDVIPLPTTAADDARDQEARTAGEALLRRDAVAAVLLAGGQGTRLGFDDPKGTFPFAPVTGTSLFAHHAARIGAIRRHYGCALPWYVMTSPQTDAATRAFFADHDWFGLPRESIAIFEQGVMPAVARTSGEILLEAPDRLALSPDGHGGVFGALAQAGLLADMRERGIETFVTYNVDNPLLRTARPQFLGHHVLTQSEMSNVVVRKHDPAERVGVVARREGRTVLVEYSDLPDHLAEARGDDGELLLWAGSLSAHAIQVSFAERLARPGTLPFHRALKAVPHVDEQGRPVTPDAPNAVKFETFQFDALPLAERALSVESARADEFSPIKNAEGSDSPDSARRDLNRLYARWLRRAGVALPVDDHGNPPMDIEIDPGYALDADELAERLPSGFTPSPDRPIVLGRDAPRS